MQKTLTAAAVAGCLLGLVAGCGSPSSGGSALTGAPQVAPEPIPTAGPTAAPQPQPQPSPAPSPQPAPAEPEPSYAREWYVSPSGHDSAAGSREAPFRTINKAIASVGPGEIIRVAEGTYAEPLTIDQTVQAGTADAPITLQGEGKPRIVATGAGGWSMIDVQRPNWIIDGFDIDAQGQRKVAVAFSGRTQGSVLRNSEVHGGTSTAGVSVFGGAHGVTIENNRIHHFSRGDSDSHGVVVQPTAGDVTVRGNDIHHVTGDSVQCIGPEGYSNDPPADGLLVEGNQLHDNRENAVDIKTCWNVTIRENQMHGFRRSSSSKGEAVVIHMSAKNVLVEENDISDAGKGIAVGGNHTGPRPTNIVLQRNRIRDTVMVNGSDGSGIRIENCNGVQVTDNTITGCQGFALVVGHGTGGNSSDVTVQNNLLSARGLVSLGPARDHVSLDSNLYGPGPYFELGDVALPTGSWAGMSFEDWKAAGLDPHSTQCATPPSPGATGC